MGKDRSTCPEGLLAGTNTSAGVLSSAVGLVTKIVLSSMDVVCGFFSDASARSPSVVVSSDAFEEVDVMVAWLSAVGKAALLVDPVFGF